MLINRSARLARAAGIALVASLTGASTLPAAAMQRVQFDRRPANTQVLYVSDRTGPVYEFAAGTGVLLATITDGSVPTGLDVDSTGTLYVSEHGSSTINEYTPGATTATTVLSDGLNSPYGVAHCLDGTTYVANVFDGNANGNITYYAAGATTPTGTIPDANIYNAFGVACDPNSNVYADYQDNNYQVQIVKYGPQGSSITNTGYGAYMSGSGQIRVTHNGLLAASDYEHSISFFRLAAAPGAGPFMTSTWSAAFFGFSIGLAGNDAFVPDLPPPPPPTSPSGEPCRLCSRFPAAWLRGSERGSASRHSSPLNGGNPQAGTVFRANVRNQLLTESYGAAVLSQPFDTFVYPGGNT